MKILFSDPSGNEMTTFLNKITTNHTFFMREMEHFRFLIEKAVPGFEATKKIKEIRIWSAGCSSGQEPYTIAMALNEYFGARISQWNISILATDISMDALAKAEKAVYSLDGIKEVPEKMALRLFRRFERRYISHQRTHPERHYV